jgi:hypothetical protein
LHTHSKHDHLHIWAYLIAHNNKAALVADQANFKARLIAALPVFKRAAISGSAENLVVETPFGNARVAKIGLTETLHGIVPDGLVEFGLTLGAVEPPAAVMPAWANGLVPKETAVGVKVTGFNPEAVTRAFIDKVDLATGQPVGFSEVDALKLVLPTGVLNIDLPAGKIANDLYDLRWTGAMTFEPATSVLKGKATVTAKGLDQVSAQLSRSKEGMQMAAMLFAAKAMAKPVNGADVWELEFDTEGNLTVNGQKLGG